MRKKQFSTVCAIISLVILLLGSQVLFFSRQYPAGLLANGSPSDNITFTIRPGFRGFSVIFSGEGEMSEKMAEWAGPIIHISYGYKFRIRKVVVNEGIQTVSDAFFSGCSSLEEVSLPASLSILPTDAFRECQALQNISYSGEKSQINYKIQKLLEGGNHN